MRHPLSQIQKLGLDVNSELFVSRPFDLHFRPFHFQTDAMILCVWCSRASMRRAPRCETQHGSQSRGYTHLPVSLPCLAAWCSRASTRRAPRCETRYGSQCRGYTSLIGRIQTAVSHNRFSGLHSGKTCWKVDCVRGFQQTPPCCGGGSSGGCDPKR